MPLVEIKLNTKTAQIPEYKTDGAAGVDLRADILETLFLPPGQISIVPTGISIAMPKGVEAQIRSRSGLAAKNSVVVLNSPGTIDSDYRGDISVILINHGKEPFWIEPGMRIAQMVFAPVHAVKFYQVNELPKTQRGDGKFGSTGIK